MILLTFLLPILCMKEHGISHKYSDLPLVPNTNCPGTNRPLFDCLQQEPGYSDLEEHFTGKPVNPGLL